jgi:biotin transporter BioY
VTQHGQIDIWVVVVAAAIVYHVCGDVVISVLVHYDAFEILPLMMMMMMYDTLADVRALLLVLAFADSIGI